MADSMADAKHSVHTQSAHFVDIFFYYAYGEKAVSPSWIHSSVYFA